MDQDDKMVVDKMARFLMTMEGKADNIDLIPEDKLKGEILLPKGLTRKGMKKYLLDMAKRAMPPLERVSDRDGKIFESPINFAPIADSQIPMNGRAKEKAHDAGLAIFEEILNHGRQTIDELVAHLDGYDIKFLTIMINGMLSEDYLKFYLETGIDNPKEKGLRTLELVESKERKRLVDARYHARLEQIEPERKERRLILEILPSVDAMKPITKGEEPILEDDEEEEDPRDRERNNRQSTTGLRKETLPQEEPHSSFLVEEEQILEARGGLSDKLVAKIRKTLKIQDTN